jgi:hypothetical protein
MGDAIPMRRSDQYRPRKTRHHCRALVDANIIAQHESTVQEFNTAAVFEFFSSARRFRLFSAFCARLYAAFSSDVMLSRRLYSRTVSFVFPVLARS